MEVRIGVQNTARELSFESNESAAEITAAVEQALSGASKTLNLKDGKGVSHIVPAASIAYVVVGTEETRRVGFIA